MIISAAIEFTKIILYVCHCTVLPNKPFLQQTFYIKINIKKDLNASTFTGRRLSIGLRATDMTSLSHIKDSTAVS